MLSVFYLGFVNLKKIREKYISAGQLASTVFSDR